MLVHDVSSGDSSGADTAIVGSLGAWVEVAAWPTDWLAGGVINQDILLFETEPEIVIVIINLSTSVRGMWGSIGVHDLAHDHEGISPARVLANVDWDEKAVGGVAWSLLCRGTVEAPFRAIFEITGEVVDDHALASELLGRLVSIEP